jgi:chemotaxis protein MotB
MSAQTNAPIIIKRKKIIKGGHHGGAWKVAYADFVTAMMAFFLLMWLLGATNEKQRKGIADYFNPTIPINKVSGGGDGAFGGDSIFSENTLAHNGTGTGATQADGADAAQGSEDKLSEIANMLSGQGGESMVSDLLQRHILTRVTDEGLIVEVFDIPDVPLFLNEAEPTEALREVLVAVADVFRLASSEIAVQAHTASVPLVLRTNPVWERSAARALSVRQLMVSDTLPEARFQRVTGFADRRPATRDPLAGRNNRIEIILLRDRF